MILFAADRGLNSWDTNRAEMGSKMFGGLNQKSGYIRISGIYSSNSCKNNDGNILIVAEVTRLWVTDTLEITRIEIWPFKWLLEAKIVMLGQIDF